MNFEKLFDIIVSRNTIKRLIYGFLFFLLLDVLSTLYILTFLPASTEKNIIARLLILKFGNFWGLIFSIPFDFVILGIIFIILYSILYMIFRISLEKRMVRLPDVSDISLILTLLIAIILHINGVLNNLSLLASQIFGF